MLLDTGREGTRPRATQQLVHLLGKGQSRDAAAVQDRVQVRGAVDSVTAQSDQNVRFAEHVCGRGGTEMRKRGRVAGYKASRPVGGRGAKLGVDDAAGTG